MEKEGNILIRIVLSTALSFLPSFLIFSVFNQYNFSISNYVNFLLDTDSSRISWIFIIIIFLTVYFLMKHIKSETNRMLVLVIITALIFASVIFYLYANFLLGNDVLVKLSADKENIFFEDNPTQNLTFTMSALMNPFCIAECQYSFTDISAGEEIESGEFSMASVLPRTQEYSFSREGQIQGQVLNRFEIKCKSQKTRLCYTSGEESKRSILITLNYDLSQEQKTINEISKKEIISLEKIIYNMSKNLNDAHLNLNTLDNLVNTGELLPQSLNLSNTLFNLNSSFEELKQTWISQEYSKFEQEFPVLKSKVDNLTKEKDKFLLAIRLNISIYNKLIQILDNSRNTLKQISLENLSESSCTDLNGIRTKFNETINEFKEKSNLSHKETIVDNISSEVERAYEFPKEDNNLVCSLTNTLNEEILTKINIIFSNHTIPDFYLEDPYPICCFYGKCEKCCDENCANENYPVIFLHGHSISKSTSADYSLDALAKLKKSLISDGYIDAGAVVIGQTEQKGLWGKVNAPIEVTASYFFDVYKSEIGETVIPSKTEGIDTYSIRLKEIIKTVKERTNKEKVIIIAHSMGGLVTRRYIQTFGENELDKIILITIPNHGIEGIVKKYCPWIGSGISCSEMDQNSILINKLNNAPNITIPVHNIIGMGCNTGGEQGDGIITESSQYLEYANNYYINGTCDELNFDFFHETIVNPEKYPQIYELIKEILKKDKEEFL